MKIREKVKQGVIDTLVNEGLQIVELEDELYSVSVFQASDRNIHYNRLQGRRITEILVQHGSLGLQGNSLVSVLQMIQGTPEMEVYFSPQQYWRWFVK